MDSTFDNRRELESSVVLLNSEYQLLNYIIDKGLKRIVEQANVSGPEQGRGRQGRIVNMIDISKCILLNAKPTDKESESVLVLTAVKRGNQSWFSDWQGPA